MLLSLRLIWDPIDARFAQALVRQPPIRSCLKYLNGFGRVAWCSQGQHIRSAGYRQDPRFFVFCQYSCISNGRRMLAGAILTTLLASPPSRIRMFVNTSISKFHAPVRRAVIDLPLIFGDKGVYLASTGHLLMLDCFTQIRELHPDWRPSKRPSRVRQQCQLLRVCPT